MKKIPITPNCVAALCLFIAAILCTLSTHAQTTFGEQQIIKPNANFCASDVYRSDLDGDGYTDILSASSDNDNKVAGTKNDGFALANNKLLLRLRIMQVLFMLPT